MKFIVHFTSLLTICITHLEALPLISFAYFAIDKIFIKFYSASNEGIISLSFFLQFPIMIFLSI